MPSRSRRQARLMAAAAHNGSFAKRVGVLQKVAREFNREDAKTGILKGSRGSRPHKSARMTRTKKSTAR